MYEHRETFEPASLSILTMRSPESVKDVFVFILLLYYQGRILAAAVGLRVGWRRHLYLDPAIRSPQEELECANGTCHPKTNARIWFDRVRADSRLPQLRRLCW